MLKNIGIIGYGFVGKGVAEVFKHNTQLLIIDPGYSGFDKSNFQELVDKTVPIVFVCVPAPTLVDSDVDISIVCNVLDDLVNVNYKGIVVIKSTIPPGKLEEIYIKYAEDKILKKKGLLDIVYSPEFLRESHWDSDAVSPRIIILGGDYMKCKEIQTMYELHGTLRSFPRYFITSMVEASLAKYTINSFLALKVVFFNQVYQYFKELNFGKEPHPEIWADFTEMVASDYRVGNSHMTVPGPDGQYGYGGSCFPKDVKAFIGSDKNNHLSVLREAELANTKIRLTGNVKDSNNS